jgi:hypothetical protein
MTINNTLVFFNYRSRKRAAIANSASQVYEMRVSPKWHMSALSVIAKSPLKKAAKQKGTYFKKSG